MKKRSGQWKGVGMALIWLPLLVGCGVKDRDSIKGPTSPLSSGNLPEGVWTTKDKKFLIHPSTTTLAVGQETITYKVATNDIDLPSSSDYTIQVKYWMPTMPTMPVEPAIVEFSSPGKIKVTYDISMGGPWEFTLSISKNGTAIDSLTYSYDVPE